MSLLIHFNDVISITKRFRKSCFSQNYYIVAYHRLAWETLCIYKIGWKSIFELFFVSSRDYRVLLGFMKLFKRLYENVWRKVRPGLVGGLLYEKQPGGNIISTGPSPATAVQKSAQRIQLWRFFIYQLTRPYRICPIRFYRDPIGKIPSVPEA